MYKHLDNSFSVVQIPFAPFKDGIDRSQKISNHLTYYELYKASFHTDKSVFLKQGVAIHENFLEAFELIRNHTKNALFLGSLYRSYEWERKQGRSGNSQHLYGAFDINGKNVNDLIYQALIEKNELYHKLRNLGVNAFGRYPWGWHLDFRKNKKDSSIYYWDAIENKPLVNSEKKSNPIINGLIISALLMVFKIKLF